MNSAEDEDLFIMDGIDLLPSIENSSETERNEEKVRQSTDLLEKSLDDNHCSQEEDYSLFCSTGIVAEPCEDTESSVLQNGISNTSSMSEDSLQRCYDTEHEKDVTKDSKVTKDGEIQQSSDSLEKSLVNSHSSQYEDYSMFCSTGIVTKQSFFDECHNMNHSKALPNAAAEGSPNNEDTIKTKQSFFDECHKMNHSKALPNAAAEGSPNKEHTIKSLDTVNTSKVEAIVAKLNQLSNEHNLKKDHAVLSKSQHLSNISKIETVSAKTKLPTIEHNLKNVAVVLSKNLDTVNASQNRSTVSKHNVASIKEHNLKKAVVILPKVLDTVHAFLNGAVSSKSSQPTSEHNLKNALVVLPKLNADFYMESKSLESSRTSSANSKENHQSLTKDQQSAKETEKRRAFQPSSDIGENSNFQRSKNVFVKIHNFPDMLNNWPSVSNSSSERSKENIPSSNGTSSKVRRRINSLDSDQKRTGESQDGETDITFVQERNLRKEADKNRETHTVDDADSNSDSDICIINETITKEPNLSLRRGRGRGRPRGAGAGAGAGRGRGRGRPMFVNSQDRINFLKTHFGQRILKCSECSFKTRYLSQLKIHEAAHPKGRNMKCSKCSFETRIKSCMIYHAAMHAGGKKFKCSKCRFKTNNLDKFISHENKKVICPDCKKDCHTKIGLAHHIKESHNVSTKNSNKRSLSKKNVEKGKSDIPRPDATSVSLSPKKQRLNLLRRAKNIRDGFVCKECRFPAKSLTLLREHMKVVHDKLKKVSRDPSPESAEELNSGEVKSSTGTDGKFGHHRRFRGRKRGIKRIHVSNDMRDYKKTSYGEFVCRVCDFVSDDIAYFQNHLEIHRRGVSMLSRKNIDIFKCTFCDFETEFETMLTNHLETHEEHDSDFDFDKDSPVKKDNSSGVDGIGIVEHIEEKKYVCSLCNFKSNSFKLFKRHKSLHLRRDVFDVIFSSTLMEY